MARWTSSKHAIWIAALLTWLALAPSAVLARGVKVEKVPVKVVRKTFDRATRTITKINTG